MKGVPFFKIHEIFIELHNCNGRGILFSGKFEGGNGVFESSLPVPLHRPALGAGCPGRFVVCG